MAAPEDELIAGLMDGFLLPFLALLVTALGRRVLEGPAFDLCDSSAEIAMDATMIGAVACGVVFASTFLEAELPHVGKFAVFVVLVSLVLWTWLLGNRRAKPKGVSDRERNLNLFIGSIGLLFPTFFFVWGYARYKLK